MKKRVVLVVFAAALIVTSLAGCTKKTEQVSKAVKIEFFQQKPEEGPQKGYRDVITAFQKAYPDVTVEMNTVPDAGNVLLNRISANDIPPLFSDYPTQMQFKTKIANGYIEKLSGEAFLDRVNPAALTMSKAQDGSNYALPLSQNFMSFFYNIELFEKHGVSIPSTWGELIAAMKKFQAAGVQPIMFTNKTAGRIGHMYQSLVISLTKQGFEDIAAAAAGGAPLSSNPDFKLVGERLLEIDAFGNKDSFAMDDKTWWNEFANGKCAMIITGSYARGTIMLANPNLKLGAFPVPSDKAENTRVLAGIDAAIAVSASAKPAEKTAAKQFLEFISRPENAQLFMDSDGAPSWIKGTAFKNEGLLPVVNKIGEGKVHDWMASTIDAKIQNEIYNVVQELLMNKNINAYLQGLDRVIKENKK